MFHLKKNFKLEEANKGDSRLSAFYEFQKEKREDRELEVIDLQERGKYGFVCKLELGALYKCLKCNKLVRIGCTRGKLDFQQCLRHCTLEECKSPGKRKSFLKQCSPWVAELQSERTEKPKFFNCGGCYYRICERERSEIGLKMVECCSCGESLVDVKDTESLKRHSKLHLTDLIAKQ